MNKAIYIQLSIIIIFFLSCNKNNYDKEDLESLTKVVKNTLGQELSIPDNIYLYKPFSNYKKDSVEIKNSELKIYAEVNVSCGTCIKKIRKWISFIEESKNSNIPVIIVMNSEDNFKLLKYMINSGDITDFPYPFFLDKDNEFSKINEFIKNSDGFKTILTDKNNRIILLGNPLQSEKMKELYIREINKKTTD